MKVAEEILDWRTEWAFQDLLIDVAAVVAATEPSRAKNANDPTPTESGVSWKTSPASQMRSTEGII
jgi:hypothetical protein